MNNKKAAFIFSLIIFTFIVITFSTTYSFLSVAGVQVSNNVMNTACFTIGFNEGESINLPNAYPMTKEAAIAANNYYEFTLKNECTGENARNIQYTLTFNTLTTTSNPLDKSYIRYALNSESGSLNLSTLQIATIESTTTGDTKQFENPTSYGLNEIILNPSNQSTYNTANIAATYPMKQRNSDETFVYTLEPGKYVKYKLYLWIEETTVTTPDAGGNIGKDIMGKNFEGRVLVYSTY